MESTDFQGCSISSSPALEGGADLAHNIHTQVDAAEGQQDAQRRTSNQKPEDLSAKVEWRQTAREETAADHHHRLHPCVTAADAVTVATKAAAAVTAVSHRCCADWVYP